MDRIQIYVPGINTFPGESDNWDGKAVTYTHHESGYRAEKVEYHCNAITRAFWQNRRADRVYNTLRHGYERYQQRVLVGHSNGADVILTMMKNHPDFLRVDSLHLVCGATEANFERNGLNSLLSNGRVGNVFVYVAGRDAALRLASCWAARLLGYGVLGLHGCQGVRNSVVRRVTQIDSGKWTGYGHSGCWAESEFDQTMAHFLKP